MEKKRKGKVVFILPPESRAPPRKSQIGAHLKISHTYQTIPHGKDQILKFFDQSFVIDRGTALTHTQSCNYVIFCLTQYFYI